MKETAIHSASILASNLKSLREIYSSEVVSKVEKFGIEASHLFHDKDNLIPLPAGLTIILGESIAKEFPNITTSLYSPYPFPWRKHGGVKGGEIKLDEDREITWQAIKQSPQQSVIKIKYMDNRPVLSYAVSDIMYPQCISCHNSHPESPKKNWKIGEVGGIIQVNIPLNSIIQKTGDYVIQYAIALICVFSALYLVAYYFFYQFQKKNRKLERLNKHLVLISNHERAKISHHLHDGLGQLLTGACFLIESVKNSISSDPKNENYRIIDEITGIISEALDQTRKLASSINPGEKGERKFEASFETFVNNVKSQFYIDVTHNIDWTSVENLTSEESHELYFIIVEAVTNAIRHGRATHIFIAFNQEHGQLILSILDNGKGFYQPILTKDQSGIGTKIMNYRARTIGWRLEITKLPTQGTQVICYKKT